MGRYEPGDLKRCHNCEYGKAIPDWRRPCLDCRRPDTRTGAPSCWQARGR